MERGYRERPLHDTGSPILVIWGAAVGRLGVWHPGSAGVSAMPKKGVIPAEAGMKFYLIRDPPLCAGRSSVPGLMVDAWA